METYQHNYLKKLSSPNVSRHAEDRTRLHLAAIHSPQLAFEKALVHMVTGWLSYADEYKAEHGVDIGYNREVAQVWSDVGTALRALLCKETGRLDGGILDLLLADTVRTEGFDPNVLRFEG